jgi:TPR repeat protein
MYVLGQGVPQDNEKALYWYRKSAEQGFAESQNSIGVIYHEGQGVEKDWVEAYAWFRLAESNGHEMAKLNVAIVESKLSEDELKSAMEKYESYREMYVKKKKNNIK